MEIREGGVFLWVEVFQLVEKKKRTTKGTKVLVGKMETSGATLQGNRIQGRHKFYMFRSWRSPWDSRKQFTLLPHIWATKP